MPRNTKWYMLTTQNDPLGSHDHIHVVRSDLSVGEHHPLYEINIDFALAL